MQPSENNDFSLAIAAQSLYLLNLLILPGLGFLALSLLYFRYRSRASAVDRCHLKQTFYGSLWAAFMVLVLSAAIIAIGGFNHPASWVIGVIYLLSMHAAMVFLGALGLSRAINGKHFHFTFIGPSCPHGETH